jgi:tetratricopeptide (TPR) repeat protein
MWDVDIFDTFLLEQQMNPNIQSLIFEATTGGLADGRTLSDYSPTDFREGIQLLVAEDNMEMAQALADAGISLYPNNEEIFAIAGLLAITRSDWPLAIELLQDLCDLQKEQVQPMTYQMLGRSLWCNLDLTEARQVIATGLKMYPGNELLLAEQAEMSTAESVMPGSPIHN